MVPSFSSDLEDSLHRALGYANERGHEFATLEHLLLALVDDQDASAVMKACEVDLDELHVSPTTHPRRELLDLLGVEVTETDEHGITVPSGDAGGTDVEGVWVAGNVRDCNAQVIDAAAQGLKAAVAINASEMPGATVANVACVALASPLKECMMPHTVPSNPM